MQNHNAKKLKRGDRGSTEEDENIAKKANMAVNNSGSEIKDEAEKKNLETEPSLSEIILKSVWPRISWIRRQNGNFGFLHIWSGKTLWWSIYENYNQSNFRKSFSFREIRQNLKCRIFYADVVKFCWDLVHFQTARE